MCGLLNRFPSINKFPIPVLNTGCSIWALQTTYFLLNLLLELRKENKEQPKRSEGILRESESAIKDFYSDVLSFSKINAVLI